MTESIRSKTDDRYNQVTPQFVSGLSPSKKDAEDVI